jgi:phospholipid/cholesterol/gamma-HCH transport system ATP-binding protein
MQKEIIRAHNVTLPVADRDEHGVSSVTLTLHAGEQLVIEWIKDIACFPIAEVLSGLLEPASGDVAFERRAWTDYSLDEASRARSRIGRVFEEHAWVSNLDLDENITLAQRHHTTRPEQDIREEALALIQSFGSPTLPAMRPAVAAPHTRMLAQWTRALMGQPSLLVLEQPTREASDEECGMLIQAVRERVEQGAAAVWLTRDARVRNHNALQRALRARVDHGTWNVVQ